jgi:hypothetical protein
MRNDKYTAKLTEGYTLSRPMIEEAKALLRAAEEDGIHIVEIYDNGSYRYCGSCTAEFLRTCWALDDEHPDTEIGWRALAEVAVAELAEETTDEHAALVH